MHWETIALKYTIGTYSLFEALPPTFMVHFLFYFFAMPECKVLNSSMGPSHTVWVPEFTVLALQPRRGIQWKTSQVFQLRQSRGCCYAGRTALCFRCCSAAICRAWLGCTFPILLIPPGTQQSQPRAKASLNPRHMPKDADSHTMCSWPTVVTGMLLTWHAWGGCF